MSLTPTSVPDVFTAVSARLGSLAASLSDARSARLLAASTVAGELHDLADLTSTGRDGLVLSTDARARNMIPAVSDAIAGMSQLATRIDARPALKARASTVDAIAGWAGLTAGASIALHRL